MKLKFDRSPAEGEAEAPDIINALNTQAQGTLGGSESDAKGAGSAPPEERQLTPVALRGRTKPDLRVATEPTGEVPSRTIPFSDTAILEIVKERDKLLRQVQGMGKRIQELEQERNTAQGQLSEYVLTSGGKALRDAPDILAELRALHSKVDAIGVTRKEFEFLKSEVSGISARVDV